MIPELGHYALVLALALGLVQSIAPVIGAVTRDGALMRLGDSTAVMQFVFVAASFLALAVCYVASGFPVAPVGGRAGSAAAPRPRLLHLHPAPLEPAPAPGAGAETGSR